MTKENMQKILSNKFDDGSINVFNVNDDESHFSILIVSDEFINMSLINRHKLVYKLFKENLTKEIHALQIKTYTKSEWNNN